MVGFGSAQRPVVLDPFRTIVEVGWGAKYLAIRVGLELDIEKGTYEVGGGGPPFEDPWTHDYVDSIGIEIPDNGVGGAWIGGKGGWTTIGTDTIGTTGLPSPDSITLGYWEWNAALGFGLRPPFHKFAAGGAGAPPDLPASPIGTPFSGGLDPTLKIMGQQIADGPFDVPFAPGSLPGKWGKAAATGVPLSPTITEIDSLPFDVSGLVATYQEKTYVPIATSVFVAGNGSGDLYVLLEKQMDEGTTE